MLYVDSAVFNSHLLQCH